MSVIIPTGFAEAAIYLTGTAGTAPFVTTFGVDVSDAGGDFTACANRCFDAYATAWDQDTYGAYSIEKCILSIGQDGTQDSVESNLSPRTGGAGSAGAAISMAPIMRKITGTAGRKGRGRCFIPGVLGTGDVGENGAIVSAARTQFQSDANAFLGNLTETAVSTYPPCPMVLLHAGSPATPSPVSGVVISSLVGWIRKRIR